MYMPRLLDITGQRFGRLVVIERATKADNRPCWKCRCDCGRTITVQGGSLRSGNTKSCGCFRQDTSRALLLKHGHAGRDNASRLASSEYRSWTHMIGRCENPKDKDYHHYGGRGISVCPRWRHSFSAFLADVGPKPTPRHSIDRINNDGNYEPGNVQWATRSQQMRNRRPW